MWFCNKKRTKKRQIRWFGLQVFKIKQIKSRPTYPIFFLYHVLHQSNKSFCFSNLTFWFGLYSCGVGIPKAHNPCTRLVEVYNSNHELLHDRWICVSRWNSVAIHYSFHTNMTNDLYFRIYYCSILYDRWCGLRLHDMKKYPHL